LLDHAGQQIVGELLGLGDDPIRTAVAKLAATADGRAQVLGHGARRVGGPHTQRRVAPSDCHVDAHTRPGRLLRFLAANGSPYLFLSDPFKGSFRTPCLFQHGRKRAAQASQ
jgi:hypothetical protein